MEPAHPSLDRMVETIEFTLISVIQGVALYFFIDNAKDIIIGFHYEYWVYVAVAFMILNLFWAQAIVHVLSFISWPFEFIHTFLYFLVVSFEVVLFENMTDPVHWFFWNIFFFAAVGLLYFADLELLRSKKARFDQSNVGKEFYVVLLRQQQLGLLLLAPLGMAFSWLMWRALVTHRVAFITSHGHLVLGFLQLIVTVGVLAVILRSLRRQFTFIESVRVGK